MRALPLAAALGLALGCARSAPPPPTATAPPELALPPDVRPVGYALELTIVPGRERVEGAVTIEVELARPLDRVWLHSRDLTVSDASVEVGGATRAATLARVTPEGVARLDVATPLPAGRARLRLRFDGGWAERGPGLARATGGPPVAWARLAPGEARRVFPCLDDPALQARFDVALTVPDGAVAVSTSPVEREERLAGGLKRVRFARTPPISPHLLALAAGAFEVIAPAALPAAGPRPQPLPVRLLRPRGAPAARPVGLDAARQLVPALEDWLGTPFPYPALAVVEVPAEDATHVGVAAGAVIVPAARLAADRAEADGGIAPGRALAPALAAQWFAGLVAPATPADAWLPAGLATLAGEVALERVAPEARTADAEAWRVVQAVRRSGLAAARPLRPPPRAPGAGWPALDGDGPVRAAAALRSLERLAGEARFRSALAAYLAAHARGAASTDDLAAVLSRAAGREVAPALRALLDEPGAPVVEARVVCDGGGPRAELTAGRFRPLGSRAAPIAYAVPVCARYEAGGALGERCELVERGRGAIPLPSCPRWVLPAAGGRSWMTFALAPADAARLRDAGFAHLASPERAALAGSLLTGAEAGRLAFGEALELLSPLARDGASAVALAPAVAYREAIERLVPDAARPRGRVRLAELYRARLSSLGLDPVPAEPPDRRRARAELARILVEVARDPDVTRALAARGLAYAGLGDGRFRPEAVSPELAGAALAAGVIEGDAALFDALARRVLSGVAGPERPGALAALGAARDAALSDRALALARDPALPAADRVALLRAQGRWPETREAAWKALQDRWDELAAALPPDEALELPRAAAALCEPKRLDEARRLFARKLERLPAARRAAEETLERIETCVALREAQGGSAAAFLTR